MIKLTDPMGRNYFAISPVQLGTGAMGLTLSVRTTTPEGVRTLIGNDFCMPRIPICFGSAQSLLAGGRVQDLSPWRSDLKVVEEHYQAGRFEEAHNIISSLLRTFTLTPQQWISLGEAFLKVIETYSDEEGRERLASVFEEIYSKYLEFKTASRLPKQTESPDVSVDATSHLRTVIAHLDDESLEEKVQRADLFSLLRRIQSGTVLHQAMLAGAQLLPSAGEVRRFRFIQARRAIQDEMRDGYSVFAYGYVRGHSEEAQARLLAEAQATTVESSREKIADWRQRIVVKYVEPYAALPKDCVDYFSRMYALTNEIYEEARKVAAAPQVTVPDGEALYRDFSKLVKDARDAMEIRFHENLYLSKLIQASRVYRGIDESSDSAYELFQKAGVLIRKAKLNNTVIDIWTRESRVEEDEVAVYLESQLMKAQAAHNELEGELIKEILKEYREMSDQEVVRRDEGALDAARKKGVEAILLETEGEEAAAIRWAQANFEALYGPEFAERAKNYGGPLPLNPFDFERVRAAFVKATPEECFTDLLEGDPSRETKIESYQNMLDALTEEAIASKITSMEKSLEKLVSSLRAGLMLNSQGNRDAVEDLKKEVLLLARISALSRAVSDDQVRGFCERLDKLHEKIENFLQDIDKGLPANDTSDSSITSD